jgi:hypothetical protein
VKLTVFNFSTGKTIPSFAVVKIYLKLPALPPLVFRYPSSDREFQFGSGKWHLAAKTENSVARPIHYGSINEPKTISKDYSLVDFLQRDIQER